MIGNHQVDLNPLEKSSLLHWSGTVVNGDDESLVSRDFNSRMAGSVSP